MSETPAQRVADRVRSQRLALGLTHAQMHREGGPSAPTIQRIEHARASTMLESTVVSLEKVLGWAPGSILAIERGGEPTPRQRSVEHISDSAGQAVTVTMDLGAELTPIERRELTAAAEAEILKRFREIRSKE